MLDQAKEFLFSVGKSSRERRKAKTILENENPGAKRTSSLKPDQSKPAQAPPTPKVKKQKLRALEGSERAAQGLGCVSANSSSASSGYLSTSVVGAPANHSIGGESINRDYSNLFYATAPLSESVAGLADNTTATNTNPNCEQTAQAAMGAPPIRRATAFQQQQERSQRSRRQARVLETPNLDAGQAASLMTPNHDSNNNTIGTSDRRRHFQASRVPRVSQVQPIMVPMMIDDEDEGDGRDGEGTGELSSGEATNFCQFDAAQVSGELQELDDDLDQQQQQRRLWRRQQRQRLIDSHSAHHHLSWRQRQAQSLGREAQRFHFQQHQRSGLSIDDYDDDDELGHEDAELDSCDEGDSLSTGKALFYTYQNQSLEPARVASSSASATAHRSYASTKRMLITASQLNNQQQLYKPMPFDFEPFELNQQQQQHQVYFQAQNQQFPPSVLIANKNAFDYLQRGSLVIDEDQLARLTGGEHQAGALTSAMQTSSSKQQLAPAIEHHQLQYSTNQKSSASSPHHLRHQQVKRSKSDQQQQQQQVSPSFLGKLDNFQLQAALRQQPHHHHNHQHHQAAASKQILSRKSPISSQMSQHRAHQPQRAQLPSHPPASAELALSCCGKLAKLLLFLTNAMFWTAGIALGAWGILALVDDHKYNLSQLLVFEPGSQMSLFQLLSWSFITLGCATILVGFCGCSALFKNNRWILGLYIFLILAIFALDLATGLLAMIFQERLVANVRLKLVNKLKNEYGIQASFTAAIDYVQTRFECCGLDGHFDYDQSLWRLQRLGGFEATVARTCCHLRNTFDDQAHVNPRPVNESMCQSMDVRFHQSYRYRRGCLDDLERLIRHKIWTFTIGCGAVGAVILLSLMFATCFCRSIPANSGSRKSSSSASQNLRIHQRAS